MQTSGRDVLVANYLVEPDARDRSLFRELVTTMSSKLSLILTKRAAIVKYQSRFMRASTRRNRNRRLWLTQ